MTINERVSDLIKKFTQADMAALQRFVECCEDPDAGGHDVEKSTITRLSQYGALRQVRPGYHEVTEFGEFILNGGIDELQQYRAAAEPVAWLLSGGGAKNDVRFDSSNAYADPLREVTPLYAAPQVTSVQPFELFWSEFKHPFAEDDELKSFASEIWNACCGAAPAVQAGQEPIYQLRDVDWYDTDKRTYDTVVNTGGAGRIVYAAPQLPQPAVVPDAIEIDDDFDSAFEHGKAVGWNAYRAAMLQGAEPVSQPYTLPEHSPCADAADHIWLQTAGEWPASGEFSELTWSCDNQHPDDTLYVRADLVGNSPAIPDGYALVPVEPTREMRLQIHPIAEDTCRHCGHKVTTDCELNVLLSWDDMLAAAQKQEGE